MSSVNKFVFFDFFNVVKRVKKSKFKSKHVAHTVKFTLLFHENGTVFRISHIKIG